MTITLYVWLPSADPKKRVGHGSMQLSNGTYISWWPAGGKGVNPKQTGTPDRTLQQDIKDEGGKPSHTVKISSSVRLDEDAMQSWWDLFKTSGNWTVVTNCCWVVEQALIKGGIEKYVQVTGDAWIHIATPPGLLVLMYKIEAINSGTGHTLSVSSGTMNGSVVDEALTQILQGAGDTGLLRTLTFT